MHGQEPSPAPPIEIAADRIRLPMQFDPARMAEDLAALPPEGWIAHYVAQNYLGEWSVLPLYCPAGAQHPVLMAYANPTATDFEPTPWLAHAPYLRGVLDRFHCPLRSVRLMRLGPDSRILPHRDFDLSAESGTARLHIPITGNEAVTFLLNGTPVEMEPGSTWYLRLADEHAVINAGRTERIHLVIDCLVNDWLLGQLRSGKAPVSDGAARH
ncbi:aspartyl/asparaginyl beta-hydroxylase domain-containing protein [Novosphingobium naphthalenivorans]|uniref:aspartyl/asparaginyl beta-hydroxylase domain-containing protein n=1 Tax=Novosphingobium naphthalenivorans TaxID=273168 RepID=UPI0008328A38|nr:aspartyl/asparaginyl beta-hydroxylase domain-containing protein [Novosphingobium naphthalenivorans]